MNRQQTILASTPNYSGVGLNTFPIVFLGSSLLQSAYDVINGITFQESDPTGNITSIEEFDSKVSASVTGIDSYANTDATRLRGDEKAADPTVPDVGTILDASSAETEGLINVDSVVSNRTGIVRALVTEELEFLTNVTTNSVDVVTSITGGSSTVFNPVVSYYFGSDLVNIGVDGYKRLLSENQNRKIFIEKIRFFIEGIDVEFDPIDVFALEGNLIKSVGNQIQKNPFNPVDYFSPKNVQSGIVDIPIYSEIDGNTLISLQGYKSATVSYRMGIFYKF